MDGEVKTDNELIARFMGEVNPFKDHSILPFQYDNSWDWLMPVVEKINSSGYDVMINSTGLHNETHSCDITTTTDVQAATTSKVLIETVYTAVVEFIKWHNDKFLLSEITEIEQLKKNNEMLKEALQKADEENTKLRDLIDSILVQSKMKDL